LGWADLWIGRLCYRLSTDQNGLAVAPLLLSNIT
jgi:hypothetical protein